MAELERGQPLKLLHKKGLKERLLFALSKGASYQISCGFAGMSYNTFRVWIKKGEAIADLTDEERFEHPDLCYYDLLKDVEECEAKAALRWLDKIEKSAEFHWQAAAWKLAKRYPEHYGNTDINVKIDTEGSTLMKAKEEAARLQDDKHGRSSPAEG